MKLMYGLRFLEPLTTEQQVYLLLRPTPHPQGEPPYMYAWRA